MNKAGSLGNGPDVHHGTGENNVHAVLFSSGIGSQNLLTFDNLNFPVDPEMGTGSMMTSSTYNAGQIGTGTPIQQTISFGLQLGL